MKKHITVLGSTGSIGTQALDVAKEQGYIVDAIALNQNKEIAEAQIRTFAPRYAAVTDPASAKAVRDAVKDMSTVILTGENAVCEMLESLSSDVCIQAMSGFAGLRPTLGAMERFPRIGLANKETIVAAGELVMARAADLGCEIIPVDSEHSAVFQSMAGNQKRDIRRIILTCSGGPFFGKTKKELENITVEQALGHPTWRMGRKITIDCATLMNKGLEIIEAMHLFHVSPDCIDVLIHRESIIHSMVEYSDKAVIAQMGVSDMRIPIQYAMTYPERAEASFESLDLAKIGTLSFFTPDREAFPMLSLAESVARKGGILPCVMNAANEQAVNLFLDGNIGFSDIYRLVERVTSSFENIISPTIEEIERANTEARRSVLTLLDSNH